MTAEGEAALRAQPAGGASESGPRAVMGIRGDNWDWEKEAEIRGDGGVIRKMREKEPPFAALM